MDNRRDLPEYKYYTASDGTRPPVFVSFLDIDLAVGGAASTVNGLCLPVDAAALERLDRRERNYGRVDVSDRIEAGDGPATGRVWVYVGHDTARERLRAARRAGTAVISSTYLVVVQAAFAALGGDELARCRPSLDPGELPVAELTRHELG